MPRPLKIFLFVLTALFAFIGILFTGVFVAMHFHLLDVPGTIEERNAFFLTAASGNAATSTPPVFVAPCSEQGERVCSWTATPEWRVVDAGLRKDAAIIERVAQETGVSARLIAAAVIPEQLRFFTAEREIFKRYFEPLRILGSLSQFSLGVSGIKQETAVAIEAHLADPTSPFYPDQDLTALITYPEGADRGAIQYARLTDADDHYYSYLYTALYLKEIEAQWSRAGFPINENPEALITLFNIGFEHSVPKANPLPGGAAITTGGQTYLFGTLGGLFYRSDELLDVFPR